MPFRKYAPEIKALAVKMMQERVPRATINERLDVNISKQSFARWKELYERTHSVVVDPETYGRRGKPLRLSQEERDFLVDVINNQPSLYIDELQNKLKNRGIVISDATVRRELKLRLGMTLKVARTVHPAQDPADRARYLMEVCKMPSSYLVFTDESAISFENQFRPKAWSKKGTRTHRVTKVRTNRKFSLLPAVANVGVIAAMCQEGAILKLDFEYFLEHHLLPMMNPYPGPCSVLIADNCKVHKGHRIRALCREKGVRFVFLPAYSPDMNPIEKAFGVLKMFLRRGGELTGRASDVHLIKRYCLKIMNKKLMTACFRNCGYNL